MKQSLMLMLGLIIGSSLLAQNQITVYGSADQILAPNQIFLSLTLQETDEGNTKTEMKDLEADLMDAMAKVGLTANSLTIENISAYPSYNLSGQVLVSKVFILKINSEEQLLDFLDSSSKISITGLSILYFGHTEWKKYMDELKVKAIENAKEKAQMLAKAAGRKVGIITNIEETSNHSKYKVYSSYESGGLQTMGETDSRIKSLELTYELKVTFDLK